MRRSSQAERGPARRVRIIGGEWRGRWVEFRAAEGLRPTPDRVRETLFNWLQPHLAGARCADLFCGSGVLGLEALSRGAAHSVFVDHSAPVLAELRANILRLDASGAETVHADVPGWLATAGKATRFDVVFLDPPYRAGLVGRCLSLLAAATCLAEGALVYVESAVDEPPLVTPPGWVLHRDKRAGQVSYRLFITASA